MPTEELHGNVFSERVDEVDGAGVEEPLADIPILEGEEEFTQEILDPASRWERS